MLVQKNESSASSNCSYFRKLARRLGKLYFYRYQTLLLYTTPSNEIESFISIEHIDPSVKHCQSMSLNLSKWEFWLYDTSILVRVSNGVELDDCRIVLVVFPWRFLPHSNQNPNFVFGSSHLFWQLHCTRWHRSGDAPFVLLNRYVRSFADTRLWWVLRKDIFLPFKRLR